MIPQNFWQGNQFQMPAVPAGLLAQPQAQQSAGLLAAGVTPQQQNPYSGLLNYSMDGNANTDSGAVDPSAGQSVGIGGMTPSGAPGTGGIGGMAAAALMGLTPGVVNMAVQAVTGKSVAQHAMEAINSDGMGNPSEPGSNNAVGMTGVDPTTGISPGMQQSVNDAVGPDGTGGSGSPGATGGSPASTGGPAGADTSPGVGPDAYFRGGEVIGLLGPNPPGPDDGYGSLDRGEFVIKASAAKRIGKDALEALNAGRFDLKKVRAALK